MTSADVFHGAKNAFTMFTAYINMVGQDIGMERAIALDTKLCETIGTMQGMAMKNQSSIDKIDAMTAASLTGRFLEEELGISSKVIQESAKHTTLKIGRCPIYEASQTLGMDGAAIEAICRVCAIRHMDNIVKQLNPLLSYRLREFRSSVDSYCIEEIVLG